MSFVQDVLEAEYQKSRAYKLYVVNRRPQTPHLVALAAVYGIPRDADLDTVRAHLNALREMLLDRTFDMARFEKRFPVSGIVADEHYCDQDKLIASFKLCCHCRPSGVIYPPKTQKKPVKFCGQYNYCPACWARAVTYQFRQYEELIARLHAANPLSRVYATTHITEQFIPFPDIDHNHHADDETYARAVAIIGAEIKRHKRHIEACRKRMHRQTLATIWRLVPFATEGGWIMQLRRLMLTLPGQKPPLSRLRLAPTVFNKTVLLTDRVHDDAVLSFIMFSLYPDAHLKEDLDLTSASLNAMSHQNMLGGTGKFRSVGDGLIARARKNDKRRQNDGTQKTA